MSKLYILVSKSILVFLVFTVTATLFTPSASALNAGDWKAGNIINDTLFTDGDGMSVKQIQAFLEKRLPYCDKNGTKASELGGGSRAQYAASVGNPAPFTCLTNYYEVPKTSPGAYIPVNNYGLYNADGSTVIPSGSKSAAQLIYDAAQQYNINPKALIIKLATESPGPLTSDEWPLKKQYYYAMGARCPDSGPGGSASCDINYSGFSMQIAEGAKLLRSYLDGMTQSWWPYKKPNQTNHILWNVVERNCGGSNVFIETKATAALYTYTPYQPNAAALQNMYGTGDNCSAYGNRNFWRVWNDWFESTQEAGYTPFFQLPGSVATYVYGANKTYYAISEYDRLKDYGFETSFKLRVKQVEQSSLAGYSYKGLLPAVAQFEGGGIFLAVNGQLRPFPSEEHLYDYGYDFGQEAVLPKEMLDILPQGTPLWDIAGTTEGGATYLIQDGKKQAMCNWDVYTKLGTPVYSSRPITSLPSRYLSTISNGAPLAMDGDVIEASSGSLYGIISNGSLISLNKEIAKSSNLISCNAPLDAVNLLPKSTSNAINNLVKDADGSQFIINDTQKIYINKSGSNTVNINASQFVAAPQAFLDKLSSVPLKEVIKANSSNGINLIKNGKSYGIPSEDDLYGLGFDFNKVQTVSSKTLLTIPNGGIVYKPGKVVREASTNGVYILDGNFGKHIFSSESYLFNYGYQWPDVSVVPTGSLSAYSTSSPASIFIRESDSLHWIMDNGIKRRVSSGLVGSNGYLITEQNSITLPVSVLSQYPVSTKAIGKVIRGTNERGVFMIENGKKHGFISEEAMFSRGFIWDDVQVVSPFVVSSIPDGQPLK
jgi:hypothetical protein